MTVFRQHVLALLIDSRLERCLCVADCNAFNNEVFHQELLPVAIKRRKPALHESHILLAHAEDRGLVLPVVQDVIFFLEEAYLCYTLVSCFFAFVPAFFLVVVLLAELVLAFIVVIIVY